MKKIFLFMLALCTVFAATAGEYKKVTAEPTDWSGEYLIVYESSATKAYVWNCEDVANGYTEATILQDVITIENAANTITIASKDAGWSILLNAGTRKGQYIEGKTKNNAADNGYAYSTTAVANKLSFDAKGYVVITSPQGSIMSYNSTSGQNRFRYFKSATVNEFKDVYKPIQLYKKVDLTAPALTADKTELDFGAIEEGNAFETQTVTLTGANLTNAPLFDIDGTNAASFKAEGELTATGGTLSITCTATEAGVYEANLYIMGDNDIELNIPLKATVTAPVAPVKVTFYNRGVQYGETLEVKPGKQVEAPANPNDVEGTSYTYVFDGWTTAENINGAAEYEKLDFATYTVPEEDVKFYAVYKYSEDGSTEELFYLSVNNDGNTIYIGAWDGKNKFNPATSKDAAVQFGLEAIEDGEYHLYAYVDGAKTYYFGNVPSDGKTNITNSTTIGNNKPWKQITTETCIQLQSTADSNRYLAYNAATKSQKFGVYSTSSTDPISKDLQKEAAVVFSYTTSPKEKPTGCENAEVEAKAVKMIENGQLIIVREGVKYNAQGVVIE